MIIRTIFFLFLTANFFHCKETATKKDTIKTKSIEKLEPPLLFDTENHNKNYNNLKHRVKKLKSKISRLENSVEKLTQGKELFANILVDSIFNYWYGTTWDFNGHTKTPRNGEIARGYFITTTMKDAGIQLNRIKLAQQASSEIIKKLCDANTVKTYSKLEELKTYLSKIKNNEVLILGLNYHVGFLVKRNGKNYFIHSNYISREGVIKEVLENSLAIKNSNIYMIGNVTRNDELILKWLN